MKRRDSADMTNLDGRTKTLWRTYVQLIPEDDA